MLGKADLDTLLAEREQLNESLQQIIDEQTEPWGVKVTTVEIKDVGIPQGMQRAMARQAEAERERRAKVINAEGEFQASERLFDAAEVMSGNPAALQLRYLQTLLEIGTNQNSTIVLPVPIDLIKPLMQTLEDGNERRDRARERDRLRAAQGAPELAERRGRARGSRTPTTPATCPRARGRRPDRVGGIHEALRPRRAPAARRPLLRPRRPEALRLVRRLRPEGTGGFLESLGVKPGRQHAMAAGASEMGGGALLAAGLATPAAAAAITGVMTTAIRTVHQPNGPWITENGWEYTAVVIAAVLTIAEVGPGPVSLDAALGTERKGPGWALAALVAGVGGSTLLLRDWERPAPRPTAAARASAARRPAARRGRPARRR